MDDDKRLQALRSRTVADLERLRTAARRGHVFGVQAKRPKPWPPAALMLQLHEQGRTIDEIAKACGYHPATVEENLRTRGEHVACGPQCLVFGERTYTIDEALAESRLPCSPRCVCYWRPLLRVGGKIT